MPALSFIVGLVVNLISIFVFASPICQQLKLVVIFDIGAFALVVGVVLLALHGKLRLTVVGILCDGLTVRMYVSPLAAMRTVIRKKSVEYMPFLLSFFLFINSSIWILYAVLTKDIYIGVPNVIGFLLSTAQLLLYEIYFNYRERAPTKDDEYVEEKGAYSLVVNEDLEIQKISPTKNKETNLCKQLSLPNESNHVTYPPRTV